MRNSHWSRGAAILSLVVVAGSASALEEGGGLMGWVEDTRGAPIPGVVISLFGKGIGGNLVTLSDSAGRFFLPSLPPGSYTLRALGDGHHPAPVRTITVLPNRDAIFTLSLTPASEASESVVEASSSKDKEADSGRELRWLLRHKRRSVLEARKEGPGVDDKTPPQSLLPSWLPDLDGTVEVVTSPERIGLGAESAGGDGSAASLSLVRLKGRLAQLGRWSLGGLVSESESTAWRMAAEFVIEPTEGHEIQAGTGYGTRFLRPLVPTGRDGRLENRSVGAVFFQDRWKAAEGLTATIGGRFSYIGFLEDTNHLDPVGSLEVRRDPDTRIRGMVSARTLIPGGDLLTLSSLASAPAMTFAVMDEDLRPERSIRIEVAVDQDLGPTTLTARTFYEDVQDQLVNAFEGPRSARTLHIYNAGAMSSRGMGLTLSRRFGERLSGSMTYTYGHSWRPAPGTLGPLAFREGDFHDLVARLETFIEGTDTRVAALYRFNSLAPAGPGENAPSVRNSRFDLQVKQGLPLLGSLTGADWDLLLAFRNLYYDASEGGVLDEMVVQNPPKRVLGGIAVRF